MEGKIDVGVLAARLRSRRAFLDLTLERVSKDCGIARSHLSALENGEVESPSLPTIAKAAVGYRTSADKLLSETYNPTEA